MGEENGAELLLDGRRMNDFNWSVFTLLCRIQDYKIKTPLYSYWGPN